MLLSNQKKLTALQGIYEQTLISKLGFNQNWPKALCYGRHKMGSLQIPNLYLEQFMQQLQEFLQKMNNMEKNLIQTIVDSYYLQAGTRRDPLMNPQDIKYTDSKWMQSFINSMIKYHVTI